MTRYLTTYAFVLVKHRFIFFHMYCVCRADILAFTAANTFIYVKDRGCIIVLCQLSFSRRTAHADVLQRSAKPCQPVTLKMCYRYQAFGLNITPSCLGCFNISLIDLNL